MADAAGMLTGVNSHLFVICFGIAIAYATVRFRYHQIAIVMKWLAAVLFAYVITAFIARPDWSKVVRDTFIPSWAPGKTWLQFSARRSVLICFFGRHHRRWKNRRQWDGGCWCRDKAQPNGRLSIANWMLALARFFPISPCNLSF